MLPSEGAEIAGEGVGSALHVAADINLKAERIMAVLASQFDQETIPVWTKYLAEWGYRSRARPSSIDRPARMNVPQSSAMEPR
jgi:hypothetical protein